MSDDSNTDGKQTRGPIPNAKPFTKGDKRINRKGRPRTFDALRAEAVKVAGELLRSPDGKHEVSRAHAILLDWATSKDSRKQQMFIEYAFGKVPSQTSNENLNVDVSQLTDEELAQIAGGKKIADVIANTRGGRTGAKATEG